MDNEWRIETLGFVANMYQPKTISQEEMIENGDYAVYGANGVIGRYDKYNHETPQLLVTCRGATCSTINISAPFSWITGNSMVIQSDSNVLDVDYLKYFLGQDKLMSQVITGAAQPQITRANLSLLKISFPKSLAMQREIAEVLDKASELVALRKRQLTELDTLAESVFYDMFGDPITNPKGWKKGQLSDVCKSVNYGTSSPSTITGRYKYIRMNNITYGGELDLSDIKYIDVLEKDYEKYVVRKGDILFNRTNSKELVGKTTYHNIDEEMIIAGYIIRVRLIDRCLPVFISKYLNTKYIKLYLKNLCKSIIGQANINAKELQSIPAYFPPLSLQQQFASIIEKIEEQKAKVKEALKESEDLFQRLMQDMFNPEYHKS